MLVVFADDPKRASSANVREIQMVIDAALMFGCRVYHIPSDFEECETAENALAYVPHFDERVPAVWVGFIPTYERYAAIYQAALEKNIQLVNAPMQYRQAMEFDHFYPLLGSLTPKSLILDSIDEVPQVKTELGYPVFIKGAVKSDKEAGWDAVVAKNEAELSAIISRILSQRERSRGKAIVRQLATLKILSQAPNGFPVGREYRVFLYREEVIALGFYWDIDPPPLSRDDAKHIADLAREAARRVGTPFLSVDVGQLESGDWIVIEVGDAQFSGLSHIPVLELWNRIKEFAL